MNLLRAATLTVSDVGAAVGRFEQWLDYRCIERGPFDAGLAAAWGAPASAGCDCAVLQPASGANVFLRLVEGDSVPGYLPIRTYGWAAIEINVQDVLATAARMEASPFQIIGPPKRIPGLPTIHPMQVRGPDAETVYLTEINGDPALPEAASPIDRLFILVLACRDMRATADWFAQTLGLQNGESSAIPYSMINKSFDLPPTELHEIVTATRAGQIFLEFDQYPAAATDRPRHPQALSPGVAVCTIFHPDFASLDLQWGSPPTQREGAIYGGRLSGIARTPEGALLEIVDAG
ncbi:VOC family protein [Sandaracinobacteroides hominis]|uniref:VOC family protein n=1 Tax=Sandaracinobacteroides hominis TaxID=2780086 RepID=UPI0018F34E0B|nr:VOC family protein [Sandaracinobacteroides hominis]